MVSNVPPMGVLKREGYSGYIAKQKESQELKKSTGKSSQVREAEAASQAKAQQELAALQTGGKKISVPVILGKGETEQQATQRSAEQTSQIAYQTSNARGRVAIVQNFLPGIGNKTILGLGVTDVSGTRGSSAVVTGTVPSNLTGEVVKTRQFHTEIYQGNAYTTQRDLTTINYSATPISGRGMSPEQIQSRKDFESFTSSQGIKTYGEFSNRYTVNITGTKEAGFLVSFDPKHQITDYDAINKNIMNLYPEALTKGEAQQYAVETYLATGMMRKAVPLSDVYKVYRTDAEGYAITLTGMPRVLQPGEAFEKRFVPSVDAFSKAPQNYPLVYGSGMGYAMPLTKGYEIPQTIKNIYGDVTTFASTKIINPLTKAYNEFASPSILKKLPDISQFGYAPAQTGKNKYIFGGVVGGYIGLSIRVPSLEETKDYNPEDFNLAIGMIGTLAETGLKGTAKIATTASLPFYLTHKLVIDKMEQREEFQKMKDVSLGLPFTYGEAFNYAHKNLMLESPLQLPFDPDVQFVATTAALGYILGPAPGFMGKGFFLGGERVGAAIWSGARTGTALAIDYAAVSYGVQRYKETGRITGDVAVVGTLAFLGTVQPIRQGIGYAKNVFLGKYSPQLKGLFDPETIKFIETGGKEGESLRFVNRPQFYEDLAASYNFYGRAGSKSLAYGVGPEYMAKQPQGMGFFENIGTIGRRGVDYVKSWAMETSPFKMPGSKGVFTAIGDLFKKKAEVPLIPEGFEFYNPVKTAKTEKAVGLLEQYGFTESRWGFEQKYAELSELGQPKYTMTSAKMSIYSPGERVTAVSSAPQSPQSTSYWERLFNVMSNEKTVTAGTGTSGEPAGMFYNFVPKGQAFFFGIGGESYSWNPFNVLGSGTKTAIVTIGKGVLEVPKNIVGNEPALAVWRKAMAEKYPDYFAETSKFNQNIRRGGTAEEEITKLPGTKIIRFNDFQYFFLKGELVQVESYTGGVGKGSMTTKEFAKYTEESYARGTSYRTPVELFRGSSIRETGYSSRTSERYNVRLFESAENPYKREYSLTKEYSPSYSYMLSYSPSRPSREEPSPSPPPYIPEESRRREGTPSYRLPEYKAEEINIPEYRPTEYRPPEYRYEYRASGYRYPPYEYRYGTYRIPPTEKRRRPGRTKYKERNTYGSLFKGFGESGKTTFFILPDLRSVGITEALTGQEAISPRATKGVRGLFKAALTGYSTGYVPTEQMRTGKLSGKMNYKKLFG